MWLLPNITAMNQAAATGKAALQQALHSGIDPATGELIECDLCDATATERQLYFDIFSDDPKGIVGTCDQHEGYEQENFLYCSRCEQLFIRNYTWESYSHISEGEEICLNCWADEVLADDSPYWIDLERFRPEQFTWDILRLAPHCIAVSGERRVTDKHSLTLIGNVEVDNFTGGRVVSSSHSEPGYGGSVAEVATKLQDAQADGFKRAVVLVDAQYQFATSLGIYVKEVDDVSNA